MLFSVNISFVIHEYQDYLILIHDKNSTIQYILNSQSYLFKK